MGQHVAAATIT